MTDRQPKIARQLHIMRTLQALERRFPALKWDVDFSNRKATWTLCGRAMDTAQAECVLVVLACVAGRNWRPVPPPGGQPEWAKIKADPGNWVP